MKREPKNYLEDIDVVEHMKKNVPNHKEATWIREATRRKMNEDLKKK